MCKVYNTIGCLTAIQRHLRKNNFDEHQSPNDLITFKKNYNFIKQKIISNHQLLIEQERRKLSIEVVQLDDRIKSKKSEIEQQLISHIENLKDQFNNLPEDYSDFIQALIGYIKRIWIRLKIQFDKFTFNYRVEHGIKHLVNDYDNKNTRYQFIVSSPEDAVMQSSSLELQKLDRKKAVIDEINNTIYGALGEQKVVDVLEQLSDDCILVNDFNCQFDPAIHNSKENDYIKSVQIDHILITPSGVFLIETKNWSKDSVNKLSLYSPVQQIKRANFALYKILNAKPFNNRTLKKHHWGDRKIPIHNVIVLMDHKPVEEFQHVKVLLLNELLRYINYYKLCLSNVETHMIANYLLKISVNN